MKVKLELDLVDISVLLNSLVAVAKTNPLGVLSQGLISRLDSTLKNAKQETD